MPSGGKRPRPGAGRKVGSLTKRTQEIAAACAMTGETPLEYMLRVMAYLVVTQETLSLHTKPEQTFAKGRCVPCVNAGS